MIMIQRDSLRVELSPADPQTGRTKLRLLTRKMRKSFFSRA